MAFLKQVAACLIHNIAITLKASESNNSAENEHTHEFLSGFCVRTLAEGIVRENVWRKVAEGTLAKTATEKKDPKDAKEVKEREDTLTVFLKAVGVILLNDDVAAVSFASIGQDAEEEGKGEQTKAPFNVVKEIKEDKKETSMMVKDICTEIVGILELLM